MNANNEQMSVMVLGSYYPNSETTHRFFHVSNVKSKKELEKHLTNFRMEEEPSIFSEYYAGHCGHQHDCCGCWFSSVIELLNYDNVYNTAIVSIHYGQNV